MRLLAQCFIAATFVSTACQSVDDPRRNSQANTPSAETLNLAPMTSAETAFKDLYPIVKKLETLVFNVKELKPLNGEPKFECGGDGTCWVRHLRDSKITRNLVPGKFFTANGVNTTGLRWYFQAADTAFILTVGSCSENEIYEVRNESPSLKQAFLPAIDQVKVYNKNDNPAKWTNIAWNKACAVNPVTPLMTGREAFNEIYPIVKELETLVSNVKELKPLNGEPQFECGGDGTCWVRHLRNSKITRNLVPDSFFGVNGKNTTGLRWHFHASDRAFALTVGSCLENEIYEVRNESHSLREAFLPGMDQVKVYNKNDNPEKWAGIPWNKDCQ